MVHNLYVEHSYVAPHHMHSLLNKKFSYAATHHYIYTHYDKAIH